MLRNILGDLWSEEIENALKGKVEVVGSEQRIPKDRFDAVNNEKNELKSKVEDLMIQVDTLSKASEASETLKVQLTELKTTYDEYVTKVETDKVNDTKKKALTAYLEEQKALNPDLLIQFYDFNALSVSEEGKIVGAKEKTDNLKAKYADQFGEIKQKTPDVTNQYKGKSFKELTLSERTKFKNEDPQGYEAARKAYKNN